MGVVDLMEKDLFLEQTNNKFCADCKTTKTPLWRGGPAGPKSLCNACGIRYRKRKASTVGMRRRSENKRDNKTLFHATTCSPSQKSVSKSDESESENAGDDRRFEMRIVGYGKAVLLRKQAIASWMGKQRWQKQRELGKEEAAAAVSLMALSCGSVIAQG